MKAIDDYIAALPPQQSVMVDYLRQTILATSEIITERMSYGIPFFYADKPLCYLNPSNKGVDVGFYYGNKLKPRPELIVGKRKMVRSIFFAWEDEVETVLIQEVVKESLEVIQALKRK